MSASWRNPSTRNESGAIRQHETKAASSDRCKLYEPLIKALDVADMRSSFAFYRVLLLRSCAQLCGPRYPWPWPQVSVYTCVCSCVHQKPFRTDIADEVRLAKLRGCYMPPSSQAMLYASQLPWGSAPMGMLYATAPMGMLYATAPMGMLYASQLPCCSTHTPKSRSGLIQPLAVDPPMRSALTPSQAVTVSTMSTDQRPYNDFIWLPGATLSRPFLGMVDGCHIDYPRASPGNAKQRDVGAKYLLHADVLRCNCCVIMLL